MALLAVWALCAASPGAVAQRGGKPAPAAEEPRIASIDEARRAGLGDRVVAEESAAAKAFAQALSTFLADELAVQTSERLTVGAEDIETLAGHRRTRRLRIDRDTEEFRDRAGRFARRALAVPRPTEKARLPREAIVFLMALHQAYESSRDIKRIETILALNADFGRTSNWASRDRAVRLRDELIEQETLFTSLIDQAWGLHQDEVSPGTLDVLTEQLALVAPEADLGGGDLASLILTNEFLRQQVVAELDAVIKSPRRPAAPSRDEIQSISDEATKLRIELLATSGVGVLLEEQAVLTAELAEIEVRLADRGVNRLDPVARRQETNRLIAVNKRLSQIDTEWHTAPLDPRISNRLIDLQDQLLRYRMFELGVQGALFGHAYDSVRDEFTFEEIQSEVAKGWIHLERQITLLDGLGSVQRPESALAGLKPPEAIGMTEAQLLFELKQAAAALDKAVPKPSKGNAKKKKPR